MSLVLGFDFGTLSCRVLALDLEDPSRVFEGSALYRHGVLEESLPSGVRLAGADWALQCPADYLEAMEEALLRCLPPGSPLRLDVVGIGVDFTASSPLPLDTNGLPLATTRPNDPHAYVKLWKHHRAEPYVAKVMSLRGVDPWLLAYGGKLSCEWLIPKAFEISEESPKTWALTACFLEAGDWIVQVLTGTLTRNICAAGFKGMWNGSWPDVPEIRALLGDRLKGSLVPPGRAAGTLSETMAQRLDLPASIPVSAATIDAHAGLLGMGVFEPGALGIIMGTSSCHLWLDREERVIPGVMGVVRDGIVPGFHAYEAGQAAVGDLFSWFLRHLCPGQGEEAERHKELAARAKSLPPGSHGHLVLDWINGNRSVLLEPELSGAIFGLTLASKPHEIYRAHLEATAFGTRIILETLHEFGVSFERVVVCGGLTRNDLLLQITADVLGVPVEVAASQQTVALGSALYGALAAGRNASGAVPAPERTFLPDAEAQAAYRPVFASYLDLHERFGRTDPLLKTLRRRRT